MQPERAPATRRASTAGAASTAVGQTTPSLASRVRSSFSSYDYAASADSRPKSQTLLPGIARQHHVCGQVLCMVIIGQFSGWNGGIAYGWPSLCIAFVISTVFFWLLGLSVAEMSCSLPFAGGPATFAQAAFGHEVSAFNGLTFTFAYCMGLAWSLVLLADYVAAFCNFPPTPNNMMPLLWIILLQLCLVTNYKSTAFFNVAVLMTVACCLVIVIYVLCSLGHASAIQSAMYSSPTPTTLLSVSASPMLTDNFKAIPLSAEECRDITVTAPRAMVVVLSTLTVSSTCMMGLNAGLMPSLDSLANSGQPLLDSLFYQFNISLSSPVAVYTSAVLMTLPTLAGVHASLYAASRHIYSLARAGYLPRSLSHTVNGSPVNANWATACTSFAFAVLCFVVLGVNVTSILLQMSTWLFAVSYTIEMVVFIRLRQRLPQLPRPWMSPAGIPGAAVAAAVSSTFVFGSLAIDPVTYGWCFFAYLLAVALFMVYFHFFAKTRLRNSPEKEFINAQLNRLYQVRVSEEIKVSLPATEWVS
ncbi:hypothetical protein RI367_007258 [Sorochytrium milnesiophthora]